MSEPGIGHNSGIAADRLKAFVNRVERLEDEKRALAEDIKEIYAEAKGDGFDTKVIRAVIRRRRQDADAIAEFEALFDTYLAALL